MVVVTKTWAGEKTKSLPGMIIMTKEMPAGMIIMTKEMPAGMISMEKEMTTGMIMKKEKTRTHRRC
jgi:hypothetical protein